MSARDAQLFRVTQIYSSAMLAVLSWDLLVSLTKEYQLVWRTRWNAPKTLYILTRYWTIGALAFTLWILHHDMDHAQCQRMVHAIPAVLGVSVLSALGILAHRTWTLWQRARWILAVVTSLLLLEGAVLIVGTVLVKPYLPDGIVGPCISAGTTKGPAFRIVYYFLPAIVSGVSTGLAFYKANKLAQAKTIADTWSVFQNGHFSFFFGNVALYSLQAFFSIVPIQGLQRINVFAVVALNSMTCCRLVLALRAAPTNASRTASRVGPGGSVQDSIIQSSSGKIVRYPDSANPYHSSLPTLSKVKARLAARGEKRDSLDDYDIEDDKKDASGMKMARSGIVDDIFDHPHAPWNTRNRESSGEQRATLHIGSLRSGAGTRFIPAVDEGDRQIATTKSEHALNTRKMDEDGDEKKRHQDLSSRNEAV